MMFNRKKIRELEERNKDLMRIADTYEKICGKAYAQNCKLVQEISNIKGLMKMINLMAKQTIDNENGKETNIVKFKNVEAYAQSIVCMTCFYVEEKEEIDN